MKRLGALLLACAVLLTPHVLTAVTNGPPLVLPNCVFFAKESVTVSTTAKSLTVATYSPAGAAPATCAVVTIETDAVRCYWEGTAADSSGHNFNATDTVILVTTRQIALFSCIRVTNDSTLRVSYGRR